MPSCATVDTYAQSAKVCESFLRNQNAGIASATTTEGHLIPNTLRDDNLRNQMQSYFPLPHLLFETASGPWGEWPFEGPPKVLLLLQSMLGSCRSLGPRGAAVNQPSLGEQELGTDPGQVHLTLKEHSSSLRKGEIREEQERK